MVTLSQTIPALPVRDAAQRSTTTSSRERDVLHPVSKGGCRRHRLRHARVRDARPGRQSRHLLPVGDRVIRLGRISYVNMAPVFHRLNAEVEEIQGVPTELNRMLLDGQLDLAPISSIEYARHAVALRILPRMCVSSEGAVDSIQLVSRIPFPQIRSIAVTPESATSVVLTKVLLPHVVHVPLEEQADAKLLIGDAALRSAFEDPTPALRPRQALARAHGAADGLRGLGGARAGRRRRGRARALARRVGAARPRRSRRCSRGRRACATAIPPAISRATSRSCATRSGRASAPGSTRSSRWRATSASSSTCPSCASSSGSRSRRERVAAPSPSGRPREGARRRADHRRGGRRRSSSRASSWRSAASPTSCARRKTDPDRITFIVDRNLNYTNICVTDCDFCAFYRSPGDRNEGYLLPKPVIFKKIEETLAIGGTGVLMQGGHHPDLGIDYYEDLFRSIKSRYKIHLHALSPPEIQHIARRSKLTIWETLSRLRDAGLDSIPGGGGEILVDRVREDHRAEEDDELGVDRRHAARAPARHVDDRDDDVRARRDGRGAGRAHAADPRPAGRDGRLPRLHLVDVPARRQPALRAVPDEAMPTSFDYLLTQAVSRIYLDNVDHIQSSWVTQGLKIGQVALGFGADDMGSVMIEENVVSAAGTTHRTSTDELVHLIRSLGKIPVQRDTLYRDVKVWN